MEGDWFGNSKFDKKELSGWGCTDDGNLEGVSGNSSDSGLEVEAYHINGHAPGFTIYVFKGVLFICDYVFLISDSMKFTPYGP